MGYSIVYGPETKKKANIYLQKLLAHNANIGQRLKKQLADKKLMEISLDEFISYLIKTKEPRLFAESKKDVVGTNSSTPNWNKEELDILGDITIAVDDVKFFDNGNWTKPKSHQPPLEGGLLFVPGALLKPDHSPDKDEIVKEENGKIVVDREKLKQLYIRRLLPVFMHANEDAERRKVKGFVNIPGLGCGEFAGNAIDKVNEVYPEIIKEIIQEYARHFPKLQAFYISSPTASYMKNVDADEVPNILFGHPLEGHQQLASPELHGKQYKDYRPYKVVAADHASWPGNDWFVASRWTDEGVIGAATDVMEHLTGVKGEYNYNDENKNKSGYYPSNSSNTWEDLVKSNNMQLDTSDTKVYDYSSSVGAKAHPEEPAHLEKPAHLPDNNKVNINGVEHEIEINGSHGTSIKINQAENLESFKILENLNSNLTEGNFCKLAGTNFFIGKSGDNKISINSGKDTKGIVFEKDTSGVWRICNNILTDEQVYNENEKKKYLKDTVEQVFPKVIEFVQKVSAANYINREISDGKKSLINRYKSCFYLYDKSYLYEVLRKFIDSKENAENEKEFMNALRKPVIEEAKINGFRALSLYKAFQDDREVVKVAIENSPQAILLYKNCTIEDKELVIRAVNQDGTLLQGLDIFKDDPEVVLIAVSNNPKALQYASDKLKSNKQIARIALGRDVDSFQYLATELQKNVDFIMSLSYGTRQELKKRFSSMLLDITEAENSELTPSATRTDATRAVAKPQSNLQNIESYQEIVIYSAKLESQDQDSFGRQPARIGIKFPNQNARDVFVNEIMSEMHKIYGNEKIPRMFTVFGSNVDVLYIEPRIEVAGIMISPGAYIAKHGELALDFGNDQLRELISRKLGLETADYYQYPEQPGKMFFKKGVLDPEVNIKKNIQRTWQLEPTFCKNLSDVKSKMEDALAYFNAESIDISPMNFYSECPGRVTFTIKKVNDQQEIVKFDDRINDERNELLKELIDEAFRVKRRLCFGERICYGYDSEKDWQAYLKGEVRPCFADKITPKPKPKPKPKAEPAVSTAPTVPIAIKPDSMLPIDVRTAMTAVNCYHARQTSKDAHKIKKENVEVVDSGQSIQSGITATQSMRGNVLKIKRKDPDETLATMQQGDTRAILKNNANDLSKVIDVVWALKRIAKEQQPNTDDGGNKHLHGADLNIEASANSDPEQIFNAILSAYEMGISAKLSPGALESLENKYNNVNNFLTALQGKVRESTRNNKRFEGIDGIVENPPTSIESAIEQLNGLVRQNTDKHRAAKARDPTVKNK